MIPTVTLDALNTIINWSNHKQGARGAGIMYECSSENLIHPMILYSDIFKAN